MAINDNFEVKISATFQGDVCMNVLHYQQTAGGGGITEVIGSLMQAIKDEVINVLTPALSDMVQFQTIRVQQVGVPKPLIQKDGITSAGDLTTDPLPASDAILFVKRCNTGGRENVGKFYLSGCPDTYATGGLVVVGQDELELIAVMLKSNITNAARVFAPVIWHRTPQTAEFITSCSIRAQISRQNRRRLPIY